ncbi:MAG: 16S rRNA (cytosine(1402)-N(4))-methyltransferase RsmH [Bacteroidales bacterium]|nr:16S rRNA (cytosine(1402)-N(4))-methyltransferase RsmH [Bacteroidales bacterium]
MNQDVYHIPALLPQVISGLDIRQDGIYADFTFGGGGHSRAILAELGPEGRLLAFDQDIEAIERAKPDPRLTMVHGNFRYMENFMRFYGVMPGQVDGILADLGVSFHHFDDPARGFSFRWDGPLDMRMNQKGGRTAAQILAEESEERLADIFYLYGELKTARRIAAAIVKARGAEPIATVEQLLAVVKPMINPKQEKKELAQVFQALRIEANGELDSLKSMLKQAQAMLAPEGRLAIITYHSLEDRLVKNFMKTGNFEGKEDKDFFGKVSSPFRLLTNKPIVPDDEEIALNPRSRSAKLRIAIKKETEK